jgi:D-3-phosphoglycerate dehydrogenase/C-terminal binding protein
MNSGASGPYRVVITDFIADQLEPESEVLKGLADVTALNVRDEEGLVGCVEDADAIMVFQYLTLTRKTIGRLRRCKVIVCCGVGFDNVDRDFARERGIPVVNVPDYGTEEVADSAIGMTLALARGIVLLNSRMRLGLDPWTYHPAAPLQRLRGRVFGIIGLGRIGTATAMRARSLGMEVIFYDPHKADGYDKALGLRRVEELPLLLEESHIVSLHCPLTPETRKMIDAGAMARMRKGSYLVNTARGQLVETNAVPEAILSGQLAGAGFDVLESEPPDDSDPLIRAWRDPNHPVHFRVIVNPHSAFYCEQGIRSLRKKAADACRRALTGLPLRNVVN